MSREATRLVKTTCKPSPEAEAPVGEIVDAYKARCGQEAVMVVHVGSPVCLH